LLADLKEEGAEAAEILALDPGKAKKQVGRAFPPEG
jgi:hypothetical protein